MGPVRLLVDLGAYLVTVFGDLLPIILALATPIAFGAFCGVLCERTGILNVGIEGTLLVSAFVGYVAAWAAHDALGGIALIVGASAAVCAGALVGLLLAWLAVSIRTNQMVAGVMINIAALGMTTYFNRTIIGPAGRAGAGTFAIGTLPAEVAHVPILGGLVAMVVHQGPIAASAIFVAVLLHLALTRTRWGLRTRASGEDPRAAESVGINVVRLRYLNTIIGSALAGLGGAFLTLESTGSFQNGMTGGRGFIALAAVVFGRWMPLGALGGAMLFASATALGVVLSVRPPDGQLGVLLGGVPSFWFAAVPYLATIVVLAGVIGRASPPAADGTPYEGRPQTNQIQGEK